MKILLVASSSPMLEALKMIAAHLGTEATVIAAVHEDAIATLLVEEPTHVIYDLDEEQMTDPRFTFWKSFRQNLPANTRIVLCGFDRLSRVPEDDRSRYLQLPAKIEEFRAALLG